MEHTLYVKPYSGAEKRLMELLAKAGPEYSMKCMLGELFGLPYNTYTFGEDTFLAIRNVLELEESA